MTRIVSQLERHYQALQNECEAHWTYAAGLGFLGILTLIGANSIVAALLALIQLVGAFYFVYLATIVHRRKTQVLFSAFDDTPDASRDIADEAPTAQSPVVVERASSKGMWIAIAILAALTLAVWILDL